MKKITRFACEICGTEFADSDKAKHCEKSHKKPKEILHCRYNPVGVDTSGYPQTITVKMSDGKEILYKR
ncbi:hypothetical protein [uncultured Selenomonas sp.]|uniref:hypothetical protein n=1 Tax=uncultured Selenomonas sp. TaxID=159275 RepID=UPI0028DC4560|nr:hypothetical protein [uncultured Selenomonas sp.]